jgi:hypothetical protein
MAFRAFREDFFDQSHMPARLKLRSPASELRGRREDDKMITIDVPTLCSISLFGCMCYPDGSYPKPLEIPLPHPARLAVDRD